MSHHVPIQIHSIFCVEIVLDDDEKTPVCAPNGIEEVTLDDTAEGDPQVEEAPSPETVTANIHASTAKDDGEIEKVLPSTSTSVTPKRYGSQQEVLGVLR